MDTVDAKAKASKSPTPCPAPRAFRPPLPQDDNVVAVLRGASIQPNLHIGQPDDSIEREAENVADALLSHTPERLFTRTNTDRHMPPDIVQRVCRQCEDNILSDEGEAVPIVSRSDVHHLSAAHRVWTIRHGVVGSGDTAIQRECCGSSPAGALYDDEVKSLPLQAKLRIGSPDDTLEREADAVADSVMQSWSADRSTGGDMLAVSTSHTDASVQLVQRTGDDDLDDDSLDAEEDAEEQRLQCAARDRTVSGERDASSTIALTLRQSAGRGQSLAPSTRRFMEQRLGFDFSAVRIHRDETAAHLTDQLDAYAFATGRDIYFAPSMYRPGRREGDRLLAHELTHVVQQAGGIQGAAPLVQRSVERKSHYNGVPGLTGGTVHALVERRLRGGSGNDNLITEAPIPHATSARVSFDAVGFADLYRAAGNKIPAFRGVSENEVEPPPPSPGGGTAAGPQAPVQPTVERSYAELSTRIRRKADGPVMWRPELQTRSDGSQGMRYVFPSTFSVADLKPWSPGRIGGGLIQIRNYVSGLPLFAEKAKTDLGGTGPTPRGRAMQPGSIHLPADIDFRNFNIDNNALGTGIRNGSRNERIWLIKPGPGIVLYVPIPLGGAAPELRRWLRGNQARLTELKRGLRGTIPRLNAPVDISRKPRSSQVKPLRATPRSERLLVQRTPTHRPGRVNWGDRRRRWQRQRKQWRRGVRRFLRGRGRVLRTVADVADRAGTSLPRNSRVATLGRDVEAIDFWSGPWGGFIGSLRFRLGGAWDFFAQKLHSMRRRFRRWSRRAKAIGRGGVGIGWRRKLIRAILRAGSLAITQFLGDTFRVFAGCATALMEKALRQILDEANPETRERFCELQRGFESVSNELDRLFQEHFAGYEEIIESLRDVSFWASLISSLITLIRLGVQVVSCLSPPALGCLWGLVAQVGIEVAVNLVVGTEWFQREVIGSRQVRNFFSRFFRPAQQGLLDAAINAAGLQDFRNAVTACDISEQARDPLRGGAGGGLRGSALLRHRRRWGQANRAAINLAISEHYVNAQGQPATRRDAAAMLATMGFAEMSPEQLRRILEQHRAADGRISMPEAQRAFVGAGVERMFEGAQEALAEIGITRSEPAGGEGPERRPSGTSARAVETRLPAQTVGPSQEGASEAAEGETAQGEGIAGPTTAGGVPVRTHAFRTPPTGRAATGERGSVTVNTLAGMTRDRQPGPDTFPVTLEFFASGEIHRITGVPVRLVGTRPLADGRTIYELRLTQAVWVESIDLTLFPGRFDFVFARGL